MPDLRVVATIPAKAGAEDVVRTALARLAEASLAHEGCLGYELFESAAAPGTFVTVETWRAQEDLDAHLRTEDIATAMAVAQGNLSDEIAVHPLQPVAG